jgi:hypothetical protein
MPCAQEHAIEHDPNEATVSVFLTVGFRWIYEPTVNFNAELTVASC